MAALIEQANKRGRNGQQARYKKKVFYLVEKKRKREKNKTKTLSEKKGEARNVSEQWDKGWIHIICVHDTTHLAVTTTWQGNRRSQTTPHKERMSGLIKHQDYPSTHIHK